MRVGKPSCIHRLLTRVNLKPIRYRILFPLEFFKEQLFKLW